MSKIDDIEILTVDLRKISVTSTYKPWDEKLIFTEPYNYIDNKTKIIVEEDFNSHSEN